MSDTIGVARPRLDAPEKVTGATRYAADGYVHGLLHARPVLATEPHARIRGFDKDAALAMPGVVAVLTAADLPIASTGTDRTSEPLAREEVVFAGQPVALVIAETEAEAEDASELLVVDYEPLEAVVDVEAAMETGAPLARIVEESDDEGGDLESVHAQVDKGQEDDAGEQLSANVLDRVTRERGDVAAAFAASDCRGRRDVPDALGLPGVHRAAGVHRLARAVRDAGRLDQHARVVRHAAGAGPGVRPPAGARQGDRRAARRRVRRQVRPRRATGRRRGAGAPSSSAPRAHAQRGLRGHQPGLGAGLAPQGRRPRRRDAHCDRSAHDRRPRHECRLGRRGRNVAPRRRAVPLAGPRPARLRSTDESLHVRRLPRSGRADGRIRARVAPRRAGAEARPRPARAAPEERRGRGRRRREREPVSHDRRRRGPRAASRTPALGAARFAAGRRRRRHGRRPLARGHGARLGGLPGRCRRHDDRRHLRRRHERGEQRLRRHRRGRVRAPARPGSRGHGRHRVGPVRGRERRFEDHLHRRPSCAAGGRGGAREAARRRLAGARDRAGRPRGGRRRRAGRGRARPLDHGAGSSVEGASLRRALRADRGARRPRRRRAARRRWPRTSRTSASTARRAR